MLICKDDTVYKCSRIKKYVIGKIQDIHFSILESVSPDDVSNLFEGNTFYFYNDQFNIRMIETNNTKLIGLSVTYNADSTCDIKVKLINRSCLR